MRQSLLISTALASLALGSAPAHAYLIDGTYTFTASGLTTQPATSRQSIR